ncbi:MAG: 3-deoxy-7-phosphoheptulonate synthase [Fimbriimonadaceae bacterium]|nr:3-deoxy-7-phosphoheptulonate synthase [Fimbriimonadaceae bacterium]
MHQPTDDLRIRQIRPLIPPAILQEEIPTTDEISELVTATRRHVSDIIHGKEHRLVVIVGPCSIHDPVATLDYAGRLKQLADRFSDDLLVIMRAYFEKPRTSVGWKGLINDPDLNESFHINKGLRLARRVLVDINNLGLPTGSEYLDTQIPQHISDVTSWVAIGARTTESQVHRELASGLSMPVGFKNNTEGNVQAAVDAVVAARNRHWFPGVTKQAIAAILETNGNEDCHIILRGGSRTGPNFEAEHVHKAAERLANNKLPAKVMVDCSHGNSKKDYRQQPAVLASICNQLSSGSPSLFGVMIESFIEEGRQDFQPGKDMVYGQSITDGCVSITETSRMLEALARANCQH